MTRQMIGAAISILALTACGTDSTPSPDETGWVPRTRIYATIVTHNERSPHLTCDPIMSDQAEYLANRALTLEFAATIIRHGAAWDMQSDYMYLNAVENWDGEAEKAVTEGKNLIQYLAGLAPSQIVLDAHGHTEEGPNYADISHMHELLGAPRNGVVGGFIYSPADEEDWTVFETPTHGRVYPDVTWTPEILWGASTFQHQGRDSKVSGVWRPKDAENFHADDPARRLINIGGYDGHMQGISDLLDRLRAGVLEPGHMYTASVGHDQCSLTPAIIDRMAESIDAFASDVSSGDLVWATLPEVSRVWREEYGSTPTILPDDADPPDHD